MKVTSCYSIFETNNVDALIKTFTKYGFWKVAHRFEGDVYDYYIMKDASGNSSDFIQFKDNAGAENVQTRFYAIRINTDDFDAMLGVMRSKGYSVKGNVVDNDNCKVAILISSTDNPNAILFMHKKNRE